MGKIDFIVEVVKKKIGIDRTIGFTLIARILQIFGGVGNLFLISIFLSKDQQGYYYTFGSLVAIQIFFELGLNSIITQYVAHEVAHLTHSDDHSYTGSEIHLSRLSSLLHFCIKVFSVLSFVFFATLNLIGYFFFKHYHVNGISINWQQPWILLTFSTSCMLFLDPLLAFLQGLGKIKDVARVLLMQQIFVVITTAIVLVCKGGLWTLGVSNLMSVIVILVFFIITDKKKTLTNIYKSKAEWVVNYKKEIFPYQFKIALSWVSGYFIFQLFNPVLFATAGPATAGQMGMSLAALNGISALSMSWITTKIPAFSTLISRNQISELDRLFFKTLKHLVIVCIIFISLFIGVVCGLSFFNISVVHRFLPIPFLILLCIASLCNQVIFSWASYLRCHKQEPFLINSIVIGILCAMSTLILGHYFALTGIVIGYTSITLFIGIPWGYWIFTNKRKEWHRR